MIDKEEIKKVSDTIEIVKSNIEEYEILYSNLLKENADEQYIQNMSKIYSNKLKNLNNAVSVPYFARVDFKEDKQNNIQKIYIGKTGIFNDDYEVVVTDWRAPISSIYYDGQLGNVEYECPDGIIKGDLSKKRVYTIENSILKDYQDIDITTNDEFLQECLNENSEARLKNIISTIQSEQNKIIRAKMSNPLIVQGVAGSGKTTVALHRIAYLVYTYEKEFNPDEFLIIAPNKFFLDYISNVLPDLGVDYVRQQTFEEFMLENIDANFEINPINVELSNIVNQNGKTDLIKKSANFKSSLRFKELIDEFIDKFLKSNLPKGDFKISDIVVFNHDEVIDMFMNYFKNNSINDSKKMLTAILQKRVSNIANELIDRLSEQRKSKLYNIDKNLSDDKVKEIRLEIFKETEYEMQQLFKGGKKLVLDYLKNFKIEKVLSIYKKIISDKILFDKYVKSELYEYILETYKKNIKSKKVEYEDLAPLFYIQNRFWGNINNLKLEHIVIDEAQDLGEFQFYNFKEIVKPNMSMTILGDISQGIYSYKGINNWNKLNQIVFDNKASIEYLKESYRTSMEIMNEANTIINKIVDNENIILAQPIERHGDKVEHWKIDSEDSKISKIYEIIKTHLEAGHINIAVITKDFDESIELHKKLTNYEVDIKLISENLDKYTGGTIIIPSYLSKGLEFDSVIISDSNKYSENILDTKLLYVACTRAMHTLDIISQ
ncbi:MAG: RNA polymerase recycling motor HelD [Clostridia bacterium]|jgi:DNA helicase-2/ATP-dependent DNA helicase PcrA